MIDNIYDRFMMRIEEGRRRNIVDSDDENFDDYNPRFGRINGAPRCGISLHVTPTKKRRKKRYGTETQYLLQGAMYSGRRRHMCVWIVRTPVRPKMKCGSVTLRQTVPVFVHHVNSTHDL